MKDIDAPDFLWADAFTTIVYTINRMISSQNRAVTPFEAFFGRKPDVLHMWVGYSDVYTHQSKHLRAGKLGDRGQQAKFLGYPDNTAGYKTYDPRTHKVSIVRHPIFREEARPQPNVTFETTGSGSEDDDNGASHAGDLTDPLPPVTSASPATSAPDPPQPPPLTTFPATSIPPLPPRITQPRVTQHVRGVLHVASIPQTLALMDIARKPSSMPTRIR